MKKVLCLLLAFIMLLSVMLIPTNAAEVDEADVSADIDVADVGFTVRTTAPVSGGAGWEYYSAPKNYFSVSPLNGGNCTWYAFGRAYEVLGKNPGFDQISGNANAWYGWASSHGYTVSQTPRAGSIICWGGTYGHVAFVEKVSGSSVTFTESNYQMESSKPYPRWRSYTTDHPSTYTGSFQGYIYLNLPNPVPKPTNAWINYKSSAIPTGTSNTFTFGATNATSYNIRIDKDGKQYVFQQGVFSGFSYTFWDAGNYTVWVAAINSSGSVESYKMNFTVFVPITLGNNFVAEISNPTNGMNLSGNENYNVFIESKSDSDSQKWRFELQSNNTYKITNVQYGLCMDTVNSNTSSGTNIGIWNDNSMNAQRYYIRQTSSGYAIVPMVNTDLALDIYNAAPYYTNIQDYSYHGGWNQTFSIDPINITPTITQEFNGHTYEYYEMAVPWEQAVRICEKKGGHLVTISDQAENNIVCGMLSSHTWLGARTLGKDSSWFWINCENLSYTNWTAYQPDCYNNIEFFMMMYAEAGNWNDFPNTTPLFFVCEYDNGDVNAEKYTPSNTIEKNGITYSIFDYSVDWQTAETICEAKGGHLVKIDSADENQLVGEIMSQGSMDEYWIDATDRDSEGIWTDHEGNLLTYTNWQSGEPNNDFNVEQYGFILKSSKQWADLKGYAANYRKIGFICEYEPKTVILGDANGNGKVDITDATVIQRYLTGLSVSYPEETLMNADVDGDGVLTILDTTFIQRHVTKINTPYPIGEPKT